MDSQIKNEKLWSLIRQTIGKEQTDRLASFVNSDATGLYVRGLDKSEFKGIDLLLQNNPFSTLIFYDCEIGKQESISLANILQQNATITTLNFTRSSVDVETLSPALQHNATLTSLSFIRTPLGDKEVKALAMVLRKNSSISSLSLHECKIDIKGIKEIALALEENKNITSLDIKGNTTNLDTSLAIANALQSNINLAAQEIVLPTPPNNLDCYEVLRYYDKMCSDMKKEAAPIQILNNFPKLESDIDNQKSTLDIHKREKQNELDRIIKLKERIEEELKNLELQEFELSMKKFELDKQRQSEEFKFITREMQKEKAEGVRAKAKEEFETFQQLLKKPLTTFSIENVSDLLQKIGLSTLVQVFKENRITGEVLDNLTEGMMKSDLGMSVVQRKKLLRFRAMIQSGRGYEVKSVAEKWTAEQVLEWLRLKNFSNEIVGPLFNAKVPGDVFVLLNEADMKELNIMSLSDRLLLKKELILLAPRSNSNDNNNSLRNLRKQTSLPQLHELLAINEGWMKKLKEKQIDVPEEFVCPITCEIMHDPVLTSDGYIYERLAIQEWFGRGKKSSPLTNEALTNLTLTPVHPLKSAIRSFIEKNT